MSLGLNMNLKNRDSYLKQAIRQYGHLKMARPTKIELKILQVTKEIQAKYSALPQTPSSFELEEIENNFRKALSENTWDQISKKEWKRSAYILWLNRPFLACDKEFLKRYSTYLEVGKLPSDYRKLIHVYLKEFHYHLEYPNVYKELSKNIRSGFGSETIKKRLAQWYQRDLMFGLFSEDFSTKAALDKYISVTCWNEFSDITGLDAELSQVGYAEAIGLRMFDDTKDFVADSSEIIDTVISYHLNGQELRFGNTRIKLIEWLLLPWANMEPDEAIKLKTQNWLNQHFGDPRLPQNRQHGWRGVSDESVQVIYRWLVGETLDQFFDIIDRMALESQWKYRKAFWKSYYDKKLLTEAWVAFGANAWDYAESAFGEKLSAAKLTGVKSDQSVLILRIGDIIFAEWSHNGKCRAWKISDSRAPQRYQQKYQNQDFKKISMQITPYDKEGGISHGSSASYSWQRKLADFIYLETNVRVSERDF